MGRKGESSAPGAKMASRRRRRQMRRMTITEGERQQTGRHKEQQAQVVSLSPSPHISGPAQARDHSTLNEMELLALSYSRAVTLIIFHIFFVLFAIHLIVCYLFPAWRC